MNDSIERSRPMTAYADTYGEPDMETTTRMRSRLMGFMEERQTGHQRWRHWTQAAVVTLVLGLGAGATWWWQAGSGDGEATAGPAGAIATVDQAQEVELDRGETVRLFPHSGIRVQRDDEDLAVLELLEGEIEIVRDDGSRAVRVRAGSHEIEVDAVRVNIRRTRGVPLVTVGEGSVRVYGPDLPADGIRIAPAGE